jgi:beta-lactam-binding protein with PASTA domain
MFEKLQNLFTNKKFYATVSALIAAGALFLLLLDFILMPAYTNYDEGVTVPDVTKLALTEADSLLTTYGLRFKVSDRRSNSAYPADYVIDQTPAASEIVKPNRKIYLTVNTVSTPKVEVPKVLNLSLRNAKIQLQNYGLTVGTISYESSRFKSSVLRQSVPPGKTVPKGTVVNLAVSDGLGEKMVAVPNIIGERLAEAQQMLRTAGLRVGEIRFQPNKQYPPNTILDFSPKKEKLVDGETLKLIVSERFDVKEENESGAVIDTTFVADPDSSQIQN